MIASNDRIQYYQTIRRLPKLTPFSPIEHFLAALERPKSQFMEVLTSSPIREQQEVVDKTIEAQLQTLGELVSLIERTRHDLSFKHGELWEDPTLQNVVLSHESVW